jgi:hypothetical protein
MLDAIAATDELGMDVAVHDHGTGLDTPTATPSQGSSIQKTNLSQALLDMMSSLDASAEPSLKLVSDQSVADALADSIPGLDPTTLPDSLQQEPVTNPIAETSDPDTLGEAFQTVSDGFEGLSKSFELLAATFLTQEGDPDVVAIGTEGDDTNADLEITNLVGGEAEDSELDVETETLDSEADEADLDVDPGAIPVLGGVANATEIDEAELEVEKIMGDADFDLDFDALKVNVAQVSKGLQFLVEQLEAAFEGDDALTSEGTAL